MPILIINLQQQAIQLEWPLHLWFNFFIENNQVAIAFSQKALSHGGKIISQQYYCIVKSEA
ncbi:MAG TPA: hypothetical protein VMV70_05150 [Gallionella sp.]|nr:hypothetical protein [Gallionella sp.]